jgi:hypothetical protein
LIGQRIVAYVLRVDPDRGALLIVAPGVRAQLETVAMSHGGAGGAEALRERAR